jgi:hypothetical protein
MFGSILLRIGTYLVETFIGTSAVKDGGTRLENVKNAIETKINDVKKTTEIGNIKNTLADILEADDKTVRSEKVDAVIKQIDEINFVQPPKVIETINPESISNKLLKILTETSFYKLALGGFLAVLLIYPTLIKDSIKDSELGRVFRSSLSTVSENLSGVEAGGVKLTFAKKVIPSMTNDLKAIKAEIDKTTNDELKKQIQGVIDQLEKTDKVLKNENSPSDAKSENTPVEGWIYLGTLREKEETWLKVATINESVKIKDLKINASIKITDSVNLRTEVDNNCKRSSGDRITTIPVDETVTLLSDASICPDTNTVWVKVRRN